MAFYQDKIEQIIQLLQTSDIDAWMIVGHETATNSEPTLDLIGDQEMIGMTGIIFNRDGTTAVICTPIDADGYRLGDHFSEVIPFVSSFNETFELYLKGKNTRVLALNFSEQDPASDGLSTGVLYGIQPVLETLSIDIVSAAPLNQKLRGVKSPREIEMIRRATIETDRMIVEIGQTMKIGMSCADVMNEFHTQADGLGYGYSWAKLHNPGVATKGTPLGHTDSSAEYIVEDALVNIDFGLRVERYGSDLQRMFYFPGHDGLVPENVQHAFDTVKQAILIGKAALKPGATGRDVDTAVRNYILANGYDSYHCSTGHQVGMYAHDGGIILAPEREGSDRSSLIDVPIEAGQIFTIEPYVVTPQGRLGIEEMVVATNEGCEFLVEPQASLFILRGGK